MGAGWTRGGFRILLLIELENNLNEQQILRP